jgi:pimeloyl-ACP methyl ester carboxylesterase
VVQAKKVFETVPIARLSVFEDCGHIPWLEHPRKFYAELDQFLR